MNETLLSKIKTTSDLRSLSVDELSTLADEIRHLIKDSVSANGGHLASNLGVVELTIALHYVFDFSSDRLLWDVGHQCYVHKILTGRADKFSSLRQVDGLSGFPNPKESNSDPFSVGHAGTAIATAVGMALAGQLKNSSEKVVAVVGDGSIVNGLSFEALNNTSLLNRQLLIVLNDNSMAIDKTQGAFAKYLTHLRLSRSYEDLNRRTKLLVKRLPYFGRAIDGTLERIKGGIKTTLHRNQIFEQLEIPYFGPVDGHDIASLIKLFTVLKDIDYPVLFHVQTEKGRGFTPAKEDPCTFHSPQPFEVNGETASFTKKTDKSFTTAFSESLGKLMKKDARIVAFTAAMGDGTGLASLRSEFPDRIIDVGIAESAAVDIAAGMAKSGLKPVVAIYSTFLQRSFDQIFQEVSLQNLPVVFCMDRAGLVGGDGAVHQGFCDISILRALPNMILMAPMDEQELMSALTFAVESDRPCAIRYPRDLVRSVEQDSESQSCQPFALGKSVYLRQGRDAVILAYGSVAYDAFCAAQTLAEQGIDVGVISSRFAKPLDEELLRDLLAQDQSMPIITVEDHALIGGFGAAVLEFAQQNGLDARRIKRQGLPDLFIEQNTRAGQLAQVGIDKEGIINAVTEALKEWDAKCLRLH